MITIYSREHCTDCDKAKALLEMKEIEYNELKLGVDVTADQLKQLVPGAKSVPQILNDNVLIGGFSDLLAYLDNQ